MAIPDAHKGPISCIHTSRTSVKILTGGKDGYIHCWDHNLKKIKSINLLDHKDIINNCKITALCEYVDGSGLVIGTRGG
jgi:WD40 repeat protein